MTRSAGPALPAEVSATAWRQCFLGFAMYAQVPIIETCPKCGGKILVYSSRPVPGGQLRYYACDNKKCKFKPEPNQVIVPNRFKTRH